MAEKQKQGGVERVGGEGGGEGLGGMKRTAEVGGN